MDRFPIRISRRFCQLILLVFVLSPSLKAQTYSFYKFNNEEGLSSSKVYKIIQDRNDYIWVGTGSGLDRFDGKNIEGISIDDGIWHGGVYSIYEDSRGLIWFGHLDGKMSYFDGVIYHKIDFDTMQISSDITSIFEYGDKLWFTTFAEGAFSVEYNENEGDFSNYRQYRGSEGLSDRVFSTYIDSKGIIYCVTDVGIKQYIPDQDRFIQYKPDGLSTHFSTICLYEDSHGDRWFGYNKGGLMKIAAGASEAIFYDIRDGLANNEVVSISEDSHGRIWVGTWGGGISVFDGDNIYNYTRENGLEADYVRQVVEDKEGNMLIATHNNGLNIFKGDHFTSFNSDRLFTNKDINAVNEDKYSRIWLGNLEGVTIYDPENKMSWAYSAEDYNLSPDIVAIENDLDGNIWLATHDGGVFKYSFHDNKFRKEERISDILGYNSFISSMVVDKENILWIGTAIGLGRWSPELEVGDVCTQTTGLAGNQITSLFVDRDGYVWIGSMLPNGLTRYNPVSGKFEIIELGTDLAPGTMTQDSDGTLWLGTTSGVYAYNNDTITIHLTESDGLLSNDIQLLEADDNGYLYIGTNFGLNRYDLNTGRIIAFTEINGFSGIQANRNASVVDKDGHIWFGTVNGVTCLKPELVPETDKEPLTHIKGLTVNLEPRELKNELKLGYKEKSLIFDYYSISVTNPDAVRYKVMLEGAEPDWSQETDLTRATYPSLSPGKYVFKVKAINSNGVWNMVPETYSFTIKPPFYFSWPFILAMSLLLIAGVWIYIRVRERNLIIEKQILEDKVEERTAEVVEKSKVIEEKNRDITASIRYAERIQLAMLPSEDSFEDTFVLFLPKDIVSGDFYWMYDNGDTQFIAAVDCTGHGVPGAFMSIIGSNSLTKIVREYGIVRPSAILDQLNHEVTKSLVQRGEEVINDGMDLSLISFDKKKRKVEFAGAYNPLVIARDGEHITVKADRFPIGMSHAGKRKFTNNEVEVQPGDMLYMFSDGYPDQFGGPDSKKFKSLNLKNEFLKIASLPVQAQKDHLLKTLEEWKGEQEQIDDILVIGTRIS